MPYAIAMGQINTPDYTAQYILDTVKNGTSKAKNACMADECFMNFNRQTILLMNMIETLWNSFVSE